MAPGASAPPETPRTGAAGLPSVDAQRLLDGEGNRRFADLRGVRWRIDLGILPSSSSTDELRRVTADCRRRYAGLRKSLLVDPHFRKGVTSSPEVVIDDPLSQNPDSMWGRFFRNAELEKMVDQDLSRLYPEHGSYFQTSLCQSMLRRILLLWCLRHPECGYRQGMHELLAPFLYVLHVDVEHLSEVRNQYKDHFTEHFEELAFPEYDHIYGSGLKTYSDSKDDCADSPRYASKRTCFDELDPKVQSIISLSDAYGAEGELGIVLSEKFMEHDAYCMFDALMSGSRGTVSMSDFFFPAPAIGSHTGLPPIIEASSALYHLLSIADSSLHSHLIELGVEPQYFALRWLRLLFGREFSLLNLLQIWDEIFASDNSKLNKGTEDLGSTFAILTSTRGAFIAALALSMILHLRSSLLASETATSCLQRLLNFPDNVSVSKLILKAKSLRTFTMEANTSSPLTSSKSSHYRSKSMFVTGHNVPSNSVSPTPAVSVVPESYWEEKWRLLQKAEELSQNSSGKKVSSNKKRWSDKVKFLSRTESDPSSLQLKNGMKVQSSSVRRNLLADLSTELGLDKDDCSSDINEPLVMKDDSQRLGKEKGKSCIIQSEECSSNETSCSKEDSLISASANPCGRSNEHESDSEKSVIEIDVKDYNCTNQNEDPCLNGNTVCKERVFLFSASASPCRLNDHETGSGRSSVASNLSVDDTYDESTSAMCEAAPEFRPSISDPLAAAPSASENNDESEAQSVPKLKDRKPSGKFQWLWKFGRNGAGEETSERGSPVNPKSPTGAVDSLKAAIGSKSVDGKRDLMNQKETNSLRNLGQSMLENIQVIESVLQPDNGCATSLENLGSSKSKIVDQGQLDVVAALRELRKISNLLSEM
uniref:Rab-GAP TBC domain-containing protein n=1 Tax=Kalanchoe fedtschenkoi TaxID=63787 RepID=A0A7N0R8Z6_KALFE